MKLKRFKVFFGTDQYNALPEPMIILATDEEHAKSAGRETLRSTPTYKVLYAIEDSK